MIHATKSENNYAFIDSQNVNLSIRELGWKLGHSQFRTYLRDKYNVTKAFLFIGHVIGNNDLYKTLQEAGFICIFKPTITSYDGEACVIKGNVDAELVLHTMIELNNFDRAVIVSGDGDFYCLLDFLLRKRKLKCLLIPNRHKYSALLKTRTMFPFVRYMNDLRQKLEYGKKRPHKDTTLQG